MAKKNLGPKLPQSGKRVTPPVLLRPVRFCAHFLIILMILLGLYILGLAVWRPKIDLLVSRLMDSVAGATGSVLRLLGQACIVQNNLITMDRLSLEIVLQCTGFYETLIVAAAILAYPATFQRKLKGLLLFVALIYVINLGRMTLLALIGQHSQTLFDLVHLYVFEITSILIIIAMWLLWIWRLSGHEE